MDFNWSPQLCYDCQSLGECEFCIYITDHDLNMKHLVISTVLPELWVSFQNIIAVSPMTEHGFSLSGASAFLDGYQMPPQVTHSEFWSAMRYFLARLNEKFIQRKKANTRRE